MASIFANVSVITKNSDFCHIACDVITTDGPLGTMEVDVLFTDLDGLASAANQAIADAIEAAVLDQYSIVVGEGEVVRVLGGVSD